LPLYGCAESEQKPEQDIQKEEAEAENKEGGEDDASKEQLAGPAISFKDVAVSVELHDSSVFSTTLRVDGYVTNNTSKQMTSSGLPELIETYNGDAKSDYPTLGVPDDNEPIYIIEPGDSVPFSTCLFLMTITAIGNSNSRTSMSVRV